MRRLRNICLIDTQDRPKGFNRSSRFCKSNLWDVAPGKTSRRFLKLRDGVSGAQPSGR